MRIGSSHIAFISSRPARLLTCAALAVAFTAAPALSPEAAYAVSSETQAELNETQQKVDEATKAYEEAQGNVESLQKLIDENQADIAEIESQLPGQRDRAAEACAYSTSTRRTRNLCWASYWAPPRLTT